MPDEAKLRKKKLREKLVKWFKRRGRKFPWRKKESDPYEILIAEMMLQKTRADAVARIYPNFMERYPDPQSLNSASEREIAGMLKPLGLYNRKSKWMKDIARILMNEHSGSLPSEKESLSRLPGLGMYIVNAIMCFAYDEPAPLIDANVARVLGRIADIDAKKDLRRNDELCELASQLVPEKNFKEFNWALLDLGATVCTPKNPKHRECPASSFCRFATRNKRER